MRLGCQPAFPSGISGGLGGEGQRAREAVLGPRTGDWRRGDLGTHTVTRLGAVANTVTYMLRAEHAGLPKLRLDPARSYVRDVPLRLETLSRTDTALSTHGTGSALPPQGWAQVSSW